MATKRKKRSTSKRRALAAAPRYKKALTKARRKRRKRGLADALTKGSLMAAGGTMLKGAVGGFVTRVLEKGVSKLAPGTAGKIAGPVAVLGVSYVAHSIVKQPDVSAGMAGALAYSMAGNIPGLADADFADDDALYDDAEMMDEYGNPMNEDGDYLEEDYLDEDYLDDGDLSGYYDQGYADY